MANSQTGPVDVGFIDKRRGRDFAGTTLAGNYGSLPAMRTALKAAQPATYTDKILDKMTVNDMVYATRQISDSAGIK